MNGNGLIDSLCNATNSSKDIFNIMRAEFGSVPKVGEEFRLNDFLCVLNSTNGRIFRLIEIDFTCDASRAF